MSHTAEIIAVGTEILLGNIANTDAQMLSQSLSTLGVNVFWHTVVGDNPQRLREALDIARHRADIILTTGGLGPTYDDLTKQTICAAFGQKLVLHEDILEDIRAFYQSALHVPMPENNTQQAELPEGDELDALSTKLEIIGESAEAYLFFTDNDGRVMIASSPDKLESLTVPEEMMEKIDASDADYYHVFGTLGGMLDGKSYITVSEMRNENGQPSGYLFLCSSGEQLTQFKQQFWSNFLLSACVMLLCASILTKILMRQLTDPLQKVTDAAQRFGGGDLSVRVEGVEGEGEAADLARTFNRMADNIQMNDNSRGQFMGNIAHELRTPMTTIKGFVDGMLDGTIPPDMQNHYLQLVSEETGRLARLIQNMLDLSKLESGEYQVNARMFNIWDTLTGVALSAEQRINDGMIEIEGLTMDEKALVYADPDLIHQVVYNLLDNAIKFTPAGGTIRFSVEKLGPETEIAVWNSGQGISPEALPYVFQRFYKEDRSRGLHARGAGLGLNICKVLVNLSGGQIRVESQQGEWCRFVFTLPSQAPNPGGMKRLPDEAGGAPAVEDPASMKPVE